MIRIGILDLQGDVSEHFEITEKALQNMNIESQVLKVKTASDVSACDGIIISGEKAPLLVN